MQTVSTSPKGNQLMTSNLAVPRLTEENIQNWAQASSLIETQLYRDGTTFPELENVLLGSRTSMEYEEDKNQFYHKTTVPLPDALLEQYQNLQVKSFMGIFPEINRAWLTIDNQLFLWNYADGSDFCVYDGLDQIIVSVALVTPRPDVFVDTVRHILVLTTPVEVVLLAVSFAGNTIQGDINLIPTGFSVPTDNVIILKVVGTKNGRVFLCGKDGNLYELIYQAEERWFQKKCRKINHSTGTLSTFMPSFLKFTQEDPIIDIALDHSRNILYTLSEKRSSIQVYDLGERGDLLAQVVIYSEVFRDAERLCPRGLRPFKMISILPVQISESNKVHLVAITNTGIRLYFSTERFSTYSSGIARPSTLDLLHVRIPPSYPQADGQTQYNDVHVTYYYQGVFLFADSKTEEVDSLVAASPDFGLPVTSSTLQPFIEKSSFVEIRGKVWAIAEENALPIYHFDPSSIKILRNELATQHMVPPRKFLCLTNTGIHVLAKHRPVDQLQEILVNSKGKDTEELQRFVKKYGEEQFCAMCLMLASLNLAPPSSAPGFRSPDANIVLYATKAFFRYGGVPSFSQTPPSFQNAYSTPTPSYSFGYPVATSEIVYSYSHSAFALYLARLLRPLWLNHITRKVSQSKPGSSETSEVQVSNFTKDQLLDVEAYLLSLREFLIRNPQFVSTGSAATGSGNYGTPNRLMDLQKRRSDEEAKKLEHKSLSNLTLLLSRCLEAAAFLSVISDHQFTKIVESLPTDTQNRLASLTFRELVSSVDAAQITKELVNALITTYTAENAAVDRVSSLLRERCPSFFSDADRSRFKARELISLARGESDQRERVELLEKSLQLLIQVAEHTPLQQICADYQQMKFYTGIVRLSLAHAAAVDPNDLALLWHSNGRPSNDSMGRKLFGIRMEYYYYITAVFDELQAQSAAPVSEVAAAEIERLKIQTLQIAMSSRDELFHYALYQWFLDKNLSAELLQIQSPFLESFLLNTKGDFNLLWQYYLRNKNYEAAATILVKLAEKPGTSDTLVQRIEYLSRAKSCITKGVVAENETAQEVQEKLDVAQIQYKIYNELGQAEIQEAQDARKELDSELFNISDLFNKFAKKFQLWESQLAILHCSGHYDPLLVKKLWDRIIEEELKSGKVTPLSEKVKSLGKDFYPSESVFPLLYLTDTLERKSVELSKTAEDWDLMWVANTLQSIDVSYANLVDIYNQLVDSKDAFWQKRENKLFLYNILYRLLVSWTDFLRANRNNVYEIQQFEAKRVDTAIEKFIAELSASFRDPEAASLQNNFRELTRQVFGR